ncbi:MAG: hypothetical protein WCH04_16735 [Gammaproteobacteria bacterium]
MTNNSRASNSSVVVSARGSVVDMRFDALLRAGEKNQIVMEVLAINPLFAVLPRAGFIMSADESPLPVMRASERT